MWRCSRRADSDGLRFHSEQLGFAITWQGGEMAGVRRGNVAFNLAQNSNREWAENTSAGIGVDDLEAVCAEYRGVAAKVGPLEMKAGALGREYGPMTRREVR
jgi:hypothetical protein